MKLRRETQPPLTKEQSMRTRELITDPARERLVKRMEFYTNMFDDICKKRKETNGKQADMHARMANFRYFNAGMPDFAKKEMLEQEPSQKNGKKIHAA